MNWQWIGNGEDMPLNGWSRGRVMSRRWDSENNGGLCKKHFDLHLDFRHRSRI